MRELEEVKNALSDLNPIEVPENLFYRIESMMRSETESFKNRTYSFSTHLFEKFLTATTFLSKPIFLSSALTSLLLVSSLFLLPAVRRPKDIASSIYVTLSQPFEVSTDFLLSGQGSMVEGDSDALTSYEEANEKRITHFTESTYTEVGQDTFAVIAFRDFSGRSTMRGVIEGQKGLLRVKNSFPTFRTSQYNRTQSRPDDSGNLILYFFQRITVHG
jgi:hypothetical protein